MMAAAVTVLAALAEAAVGVAAIVAAIVGGRV